MPLFEADEQTQGIVIYTEPGGRMEAELARWVTENNSRLPIVAFMAGRFMDEMPGMSFGHAGTIVEGKEDTASEKIARLAPGRHHGRRAHRGHPRDDPGEDRREERSGVRKDGIFIAVEVDDSAAADAALARKLTEACPVDIFAQKADGSAGDRREEPRRVRALPSLPRRLAERCRQGDQALRRWRRPRLRAMCTIVRSGA